MFVIGISGKKQSGKDTVCDLISKHLAPNHSVRLAFADELKYEVANACGVSLHYIETNKSNFRLLLQAWGTDFRRELTDPSYWIKKVGVKLVRLPIHIHTAIIPDVRFLNEASFIKEIGGHLIRVNRASIESNDLHSSEIDLDNYKHDYTVENNSSIDELSKQIKIILQDIMK